MPLDDVLQKKIQYLPYFNIHKIKDDYKNMI